MEPKHVYGTYIGNDKLCCRKSMQCEIYEGCMDGCCFGVFCKPVGCPVPCWGLQCDEIRHDWYCLPVCFPVRVVKEKKPGEENNLGRGLSSEEKEKLYNVEMKPVVLCDLGQACIRVKDKDGNEIEGAFTTGEDSPLAPSAAAKMERT